MPDLPLREPPELVIFDCDGVLVDSERITLGVMGAWIRQCGWELTDVETMHRYKGGHIDRIKVEVERQVGREIPDFIEGYRANMFAAFERGVPQIEGIATLLDALDSQGVRTCVASNGPHVKMDATLASSGLASRFEGRIYSADDVGTPKPDPALFLHAAGVFGALTDRCVVIDDSPAGIVAGRAAGMRSIAFSDLTPPEAFEEANPDALVTSIHDVARLIAIG